ncbi:hypothetical protein B0J18DRAFT_205574 [Chaetomium sp. MPI-SDFR-AT-0129]|nr:hypothetical protein B0J18DRAFT_205574 [Chaetomium sp. MPI-SDFR-AT-0129]
MNHFGFVVVSSWWGYLASAAAAFHCSCLLAGCREQQTACSVLFLFLSFWGGQKMQAVAFVAVTGHLWEAVNSLLGDVVPSPAVFRSYSTSPAAVGMPKLVKFLADSRDAAWMERISDVKWGSSTRGSVWARSSDLAPPRRETFFCLPPKLARRDQQQAGEDGKGCAGEVTGQRGEQKVIM